MRKIVPAADLGGAPMFKNDLRDVFNGDIWAALDGMLASRQADSQGIIISGCVLSDNAGNFDMTAGVVYLNGEFMRIAAATNQTFPKFIAPKTPVSDSRTFADGTTHAVVETKEAELVASAGSGQEITISSLTVPDSRRLKMVVGSVDADIVNTDVVVQDKYNSSDDVDDFSVGTIQHVSDAAGYANAPHATGTFIVHTISSGVSNGEKYQWAIRVSGAGAGEIFVRNFPAPSGPWGSWSSINT